MQTAIRASTSGSAASGASRTRAAPATVAPRLPCRRAPAGRPSVAVAAKGKGRRGGIPGQAEMVRVEPPVPEVDAENAEFVIFIRAKNFFDQKMKVEMKASPWVPLTIVKGGQAANYLAKAMENEWGRKLYSKTLIRNIGQACYKDRDQIEKGLKSQYPNLRSVPSSNFEYAMKIRDKTVPKDWYKDVDLTILPPEPVLAGTALDDLKKFFSSESLSSMFA